MVTNADETAAVETRAQHAEEIMREAIGGHRRAAVRRIVLWVLLFAGVATGTTWLTISAAALLALTDQLV